MVSREPSDVLTLATSRRAHRHAVDLGMFGLASGRVVWAVLYLLALVDFHIEYVLPLQLFGLYSLTFDDLSLVPGLAFGVIIGVALYRRRLTSLLQIGIYALAATASNFAAYNLATHLADDGGMLRLTWIGMIAGLLGAACLTVLSLPMFPFIRHWRPCLLMLLAGLLLGGLLSVALSMGIFPFGLLALYGPWQAGYAAVLGAALPRIALQHDRQAGPP